MSNFYAEILAILVGFLLVGIICTVRDTFNTNSFIAKIPYPSKEATVVLRVIAAAVVIIAIVSLFIILTDGIAVGLELVLQAVKFVCLLTLFALIRTARGAKVAEALICIPLLTSVPSIALNVYKLLIGS